MKWVWLFCCLLTFQIFAAETSLIEGSFGEAAPDLLSRLQQHIKFDKEGNNTVGFIAIEDHNTSISQATWLYVKKALEYYREKKPAFIILKLNTPGGQVFPAQEIADALRDMDIEHNIPIVAFIDDWALSAGAMLAYASRFITTTSNGLMGAAEPVIQSSEGKVETASEKVNSAIRADFANRARVFGRNPDIAEAMVDKDVLIVWRDGKVVRLDSSDEIQKTGPNPDVVISNSDKILTLTALDMMKYGVGDLLLKPHVLPLISESEKEKGVWPADKMLLFQYPFFKDIPNVTIDAYKMDWKTKLFVFLASPVVSSLLFMGLLLGFYIEINTPGFGLAGTVALTCLFLIALSSFSLEIANWLELILLLAGIGFILTELFIIPTQGLLGIVGALFFLVGLFGMLLPSLDKVEFDWDTATFNAAGEMILEKLGWLSGALILALAIIVFLSRYIAPHFKTLQRLVLEGGEQEAMEGYIAGPEKKELPAKGSEAIVISALRPAGKVIIQDKTYQAMTYGVFLPEGAKVKVVGYSSGTLVVEPTDYKEEE